MKIITPYFAILFAYYILGAYATTDILRLLRGSTVSVNAPDCYCPRCNTRILLRDQLPIFSYFKNHGSCRNCKSHIPISDLFLEIFLFIGLSGITIISRFSWIGFFLCILFYETTKLTFLLRFGKRKNQFGKNLVISLLNNLFLFTILAFFFALAQISV